MLAEAEVVEKLFLVELVDLVLVELEYLIAELLVAEQ
jgi:hypothetical protein